jgi:hypothetical protein
MKGAAFMEFAILRDQIAFVFYKERGIYSDVTDLETLFKYRKRNGDIA